MGLLVLDRVVILMFERSRLWMYQVTRVGGRKLDIEHCLLLAFAIPEDARADALELVDHRD